MLSVCYMNAMVAPLSPRQREILSLSVRNLSEQEIANQLGISTHTVDSHLRKAYARLGAQSRMQAVLLALHYHQLVLDELIAPLTLVA